MTKVAYLERLGSYRLRVRFSDGSGGIHDLADMAQRLRRRAGMLRREMKAGRRTHAGGRGVGP